MFKQTQRADGAFDISHDGSTPFILNQALANVVETAEEVFGTLTLASGDLMVFRIRGTRITQIDVKPDAVQAKALISRLALDESVDLEQENMLLTAAMGIHNSMMKDAFMNLQSAVNDYASVSAVDEAYAEWKATRDAAALTAERANNVRERIYIAALSEGKYARHK